VIEKVSGVSYYEYVRKHIFEPAGCTPPIHCPNRKRFRNAPRLYAQSRRLGDQRGHAALARTSAGGGYSTVGDLLRFARALSSGKLIKPELFAQMTTKQAGQDTVSG